MEIFFTLKDSDRKVASAIDKKAGVKDQSYKNYSESNYDEINKIRLIKGD